MSLLEGFYRFNESNRVGNWANKWRSSPIGSANYNFWLFKMQPNGSFVWAISFATSIFKFKSQYSNLPNSRCITQSRSPSGISHIGHEHRIWRKISRFDTFGRAGQCYHQGTKMGYQWRIKIWGTCFNGTDSFLAE